MVDGKEGGETISILIALSRSYPRFPVLYFDIAHLNIYLPRLYFISPRCRAQSDFNCRKTENEWRPLVRPRKRPKQQRIWKKKESNIVWQSKVSRISATWFVLLIHFLIFIAYFSRARYAATSPAGRAPGATFWSGWSCLHNTRNCSRLSS